MNSKYTSRTAAGAWVLTVVAAGGLSQVDSIAGWAMLTLIAAGPAFFLIRWQMGPEQTLSQTIQKALR